MHRPVDIAQGLDVSVTTLRRWSKQFEAHLSPMAGSAVAETGGATKRRYTRSDVALLLAVQHAFKEGHEAADIQERLADGTLEAVSDVVVSNTMARLAGDVEPESPTESPLGDANHPWAVAVIPENGDNQQLALAMTSMAEALQALPALTAAISEAHRAAAVLAEATASHQAVLEQILQQQAIAPQVPAPALSIGQRIRRMFTGEV